MFKIKVSQFKKLIFEVQAGQIDDDEKYYDLSTLKTPPAQIKKRTRGVLDKSEDILTKDVFSSEDFVPIIMRDAEKLINLVSRTVISEELLTVAERIYNLSKRLLEKGLEKIFLENIKDLADIFSSKIAQLGKTPLKRNKKNLEELYFVAKQIYDNVSSALA